MYVPKIKEFQDQP